MNALNLIAVMAVLLLVGCKKEEITALQLTNKELESSKKDLENLNANLKEEVANLNTSINNDLVSKVDYDSRLEELKTESAKVKTVTTSLVAAQAEIEKLISEKNKLVAEVAKAKTKAAEAELAALKAKVDSEKLPPAFQNQLLALMEKGSRLVNSTERPKIVKKGSANQECEEAITEFSTSLETTLTLWPKDFEPQEKVKLQSFAKAYLDWKGKVYVFRSIELRLEFIGGSNSLGSIDASIVPTRMPKEITNINTVFKETRTEVLSKLK